MSALNTNIIANLFGRAWTALISLAVIPLYINLMGMEAYGLVGIYTTLQAVFILLDMGMGATINRELARLSSIPGGAGEMLDFSYSLERIYLCIGALLMGVIIGLSHYLAAEWIDSKFYEPGEVEYVIRLMGVAVALQWPVSIYSNGLMGLQEQALNSVLNILLFTLRGVGGVTVLWVVNPTVEVFFVWIVMVNVVQILVYRRYFYRALPAVDGRPRFDMGMLKSRMGFAVGMMGVTISISLMLYTDKIILSKLVSLEEFGYYSIAASMALTLRGVVEAIRSAIYPRLVQCLEVGDWSKFKGSFHYGSQLISVVFFPLIVVLVVFSSEILTLWVRNADVVANTHGVLSILLVATGINSLIYIPYAANIASARIRGTAILNMVVIIIQVPVLVVAATAHGIVGAAWVMVASELGYALVYLRMTFRDALQDELGTWVVRDVVVPLAMSVGVVAACSIYYRDVIEDGLFLAATLSAILLLALFLTGMTVESARSLIVNGVRRFLSIAG